MVRKGKYVDALCVKCCSSVFGGGHIVFKERKKEEKRGREKVGERRDVGTKQEAERQKRSGTRPASGV